MTKEKVVVKTVENTQPELIWQEIKNISLNLYGMPGKTVEEHFQHIIMSPTDLYLKQTSVAPLAASTLADLLEPKFNVDLSGSYIIIARK